MNDDEDVPLEEPYNPAETFDCPFEDFNSDVLRGVAKTSPAWEGVPVRRPPGDTTLEPGRRPPGIAHRETTPRWSGDAPRETTPRGEARQSSPARKRQSPNTSQHNPESLERLSPQRRPDAFTRVTSHVVSHMGLYGMSFDPPGAFLGAPRQSPPAPLRKLVTVSAQTKLEHDFAEGGESQLDFKATAAWDDVSGQALDADEVVRARAKEMSYIADKEVWRKIPRSAARRNGWKVIPTRWIDINKGSAQDPCYRSRLVAKEFNTGAEEGLFAATPPLEAVRLLLSDVATAREARPNEDRVIMVNDVARAFFEAPMKRYVCVELPPEARAENDAQDYVGLLLMSLYGTRDAAANFQAEVRKFMLTQGFQQAQYNPQVFWHQGRDLRTLVHGDDFMTSGNRVQA